MANGRSYENEKGSRRGDYPSSRALTAAAITELREWLGTQADLARALGVTVATVSRYENGRFPSQRVLRQLEVVCRALKAPKHLAPVFRDKWEALVVQSVEYLPSYGSARRVPMSTLAAWRETLDGLEVSAASRPALHDLSDEIALFITGDYPR